MCAVYLQQCLLEENGLPNYEEMLKEVLQENCLKESFYFGRSILSLFKKEYSRSTFPIHHSYLPECMVKG